MSDKKQKIKDSGFFPEEYLDQISNEYSEYLDSLKRERAINKKNFIKAAEELSNDGYDLTFAFS